jgi:hypothetical protein
MDMSYMQGKLMHIDGKEDAQEGTVGTLCLPVQAQGVTIPPREPDPVLFSYNYTKGGQSSLRQLLVKLNSFAGDPARFSVLIPAAAACCDGDGEWLTQTVDITLVDDKETVVAINPHGLAQYGNYLYLVDNETKKIVITDAGALEDAADGTAVEVRTFDLSGELAPNGRGQADIVLGQKLYALYGDNDAAATQFGPGKLFRLSINSTTGALTLDIQTTVGTNPQSIIPVIRNVSNADTVYLLIPAIGGRQDYTGITNGILSNIAYVEAEAETWDDPALIKVTGDPAATPATAYDIHAVAAAMRDEDSALFILTQLYTDKSSTALWRIYRTTVGEFFGLPDNTALSKGVGAEVLTVVDQGTVTATNAYSIPFGIFMWDILYEQVPDTTDDSGDRVWVALGSPILVTRAGLTMFDDPAYGSPTGIYQNAFVEFGFLGGVNVNMGAFDLLIETANQAKRGVSLKRNFRRALAVPRPTDEDIAAAKAAQAKAAKAKAGK